MRYDLKDFKSIKVYADVEMKYINELKEKGMIEFALLELGGLKHILKVNKRRFILETQEEAAKMKVKKKTKTIFGIIKSLKRNLVKVGA